MDDVKAMQDCQSIQRFWLIEKPNFRSPSLPIPIKRIVHKATVLAVLLYGGEMWNLKAGYVRCLNSFHNRCVWAILGITRHRKWKERLTSKHQQAGLTWIGPFWTSSWTGGYNGLVIWGIWMRRGYQRRSCLDRSRRKERVMGERRRTDDKRPAGDWFEGWLVPSLPGKNLIVSAVPRRCG